jgi:hypothetical protein
MKRCPKGTRRNKRTGNCEKKKLIQSIGKKSPNKMDKELIVPLSKLKDDYLTFENIVKMLPLDIPLLVIHQLSNKQILSGIKILTKDINIYLNLDYNMFRDYKNKYILIENNKITIQYHTNTNQVDFEYYNLYSSKQMFKDFAKTKNIPFEDEDDEDDNNNDDNDDDDDDDEDD